MSLARPILSSTVRRRLHAASGTVFSLFATASAWSATPDAPAGELEEIVVTASLRNQTVGEIPASATVLSQATLEASGLQHFGDVLALVPNLNWSGGTSRPRFFQLRGVGELEQYQGAPNPSVGFLIDDIDLSGVGMPATLYDTEQVEVLRGPQGTRFGANALAGLIKLKTRDPEPVPELRAELMAGDHDTWSVGAIAGDALGQAGSAWRLVAQRFSSDGFLHNAWLDRDDTNGRDETTLRGKLRLHVSDDWGVDLAGLYVDLDNDYDAFALDNSRRTLSDRPGRDAQRTAGASANVHGTLGTFDFTSVTAYARSDSVYSFDGDWANDPYWGAFAPYDYFSRFVRERTTLTQDFRLGGHTDGGVDWVGGVYANRLEERSDQRDDFAGEPWRQLDSDYDATNVAAYGEAEWPLGERAALSAGVRVERRTATYTDSDGTRFEPDDTMAGGHVSLEGLLGSAGHWYLTASRGYKAGGFNIGALVPDDRRQFEPEYLWNLEAGVRAANAERDLQGEVSVFHMWREDQQVATSFQLDPGDPLSYVFYTDNAAKGRNYGLEASGSWRAWRQLSLGATLGLLHSEYLGYRFGDRNLDGREQAHAPSYQYSVSLQWGGERGWMARADLSGADDFYFDASHDQRSQPYTLLNLKAGYAGDAWSAYAWARNLTDEVYAVRGFYFGLEPPEFANKPYVQRGDGRLFGVTFEWRW